MTGVRYAVAGSLLFAIQWLVAKEKPALPSRAQWMDIAVTALLLIVVGNGLLCVAETRVESGTAALLIATTPIWMLLLDALRSRRAPHAAAIAGLILGTAGIAVLVGKGAGHADAFFAALTLAASISWALGSIYASGKDHSSLNVALEMAVGGAMCIAVGLLAGEAHHFVIRAITGTSLLGMLWLVTAGAMVGYTSYAFALRTLPTATVATYGYVTPVVAVILGALVLREPLTLNVVAGGAAVIASVVLILLGNRNLREEEAP
jgi:drug/metabolite transporter (DMT)-like permease